MPEEKIYVLVSPTNIAIVETAEAAHNVLYCWPLPYCEAFSVNSREEAQLLSSQIYTARWAIRPEFFNVAPMGIPHTIPCYVIHPNASIAEAGGYMPMLPGQNVIVDTPPSCNTPACTPQVADYQVPVNVPQPGPLALSGAWSVVYQGRYAVEDNLSALVCLLEVKNYAHATWFPNAQSAGLWALKSYVDNFCRFYDLRDVELHRLPRILNPGEEYTDPRFEGNNMKFSDNTALKSLREHGLL